MKSWLNDGSIPIFWIAFIFIRRIVTRKIRDKYRSIFRILSQNNIIIGCISNDRSNIDRTFRPDFKWYHMIHRRKMQAGTRSQCCTDLDSSQNSFGVQSKIKFTDRIEGIELKDVLLLTKATTWYIGSHAQQHTCLELIMLIQQILMHTIPWSRYRKYKCAELQRDKWNCVSSQVFLYGAMRNWIIEIVGGISTIWSTSMFSYLEFWSIDSC